MEDRITELKGAEVERDDGDAESNAHAAEHAAVQEAITEGLLQPHGTSPNTKQDGIFPLLCKNPNCLNNRIMGNHKLSKAIDIKDELEADRLLFSEHQLNLRHKDSKNDFKQMFQCEVAYQVVAGHNVHQRGQQSPGGRHRNGCFWQHHGIHLQGWKGPIWIRTMVLDPIWRL
jgi:hypothetical protein